MVYRMASLLMTFSVLTGHSPIASLFKWDMCRTQSA